MTNKILVVALTALFTAMVVFAAGAALIGAYLVEGDAKASNRPYYAFVPALLVAATAAHFHWRTARWGRFALVQIGCFALIFVVMLALGF